MGANLAVLLTDESSLPFSPGKAGLAGHFRPRVFLFHEGEEWCADLLRTELNHYNITLDFYWWLEHADGRWQLRVTPQCITIVSGSPSGAPVERLPDDAVDALVAFLAAHWPGVSPDVLRILLEHPEWKLQDHSELRQCSVELTLAQRDFIIGTARSLKGFERRVFMARTVQVLNMSQRHAAKTFRWNRCTLRKGVRELGSGVRYPDRYSARGRRGLKHHLPHLLDDIQDVLDAFPRFCVTISQIQAELVTQRGYSEEELPCLEAVRIRRNLLEVAQVV
jgi:hypothetical protein